MKQKIHCNRCERLTNHRCAHEEVQWYSDPEDGSGEFEVARMWVCEGCDAASLELASYWSSCDEDGSAITDPGECDPDYDLWLPQRNAAHLKPKQFQTLPERLKRIYKETIHACNDGLSMLCAIGIRSLIEGICADQEIGGNTLAAKIDGLAKILPKNIVTNLHNLRFMGNEAAHELHPSDNKELRLAIQICEDLLNFLYELDYNAFHLAEMRRARGAGHRAEPPEVTDED